VTNEKEWKAFCNVHWQSLWTKLPKFATAADRVKNAAALDSLIEDWTLPPRRLRSHG